MNNNYLEWWDTLALEDKFYHVIPWLKGKGMNVTDKHPHTLKDDEIKDLFDIFNDLNEAESKRKFDAMFTPDCFV